MKLGTDFSGIGAPEQALKNLGCDFESVFACEIDKHARKTFLANHKTQTMYEDITKRNHSEVPKLDLYVAGFPCQAFSIAGKRNGFDEARGTLFFNVAEFIQINQPSSFILENVKGLLSHEGGRTMQTILDILSNGGGTVNGQMSLDMFDDGLGYHIYYQVLNTKEHGIPQNRERVFIVGFKESRDYRFPKTEPLKLKLKDMLEDEVDEKYYLSEKAIASIVLNENNMQPTKVDPEIASTLQAPGHSCGTYKGMTAVSDNVKIKSATQQGFEIAHDGDAVNYKNPKSKTRRGRVGKEVAQTLEVNQEQGVVQLNRSTESGGKQPYQQNRVYDKQAISPALSAEMGHRGLIVNTLKIRRLTPTECFRLQNFPDDFVKPCSNSQLYKQAGNSITVRVIQKVIENIYKPQY